MENLPEVANGRLSGDLFFDADRFELAQRVAKGLQSADMVPDRYRGNTGNTLIVLDLAARMGNISPFMLMKSIHFIHNETCLDGKLVIALVNGCGRFEPIQFKIVGDIKTPDNGEDGVIAFAKEIKSGIVLEGPKVDWDMVKAEGWYGKSGSKWKSISTLMFRYRSATYFARTYCPEVLLGMQTKDEVIDVVDLSKGSNGTYEASESDKAKVAELKKEMKTEDGLHGPDEVTPPDPLDRRNWINLQPAGYPTFIYKHPEEIKKLKIEDPPLYEEMRAKWYRLSNEPWPHDPVAVEVTETTETVEQDQDNGSTGEDELRKQKAQFNYWKQANPKAVAAAYNDASLECNAKPMEEWSAADYRESVKKIQKAEEENEGGF